MIPQISRSYIRLAVANDTHPGRAIRQMTGVGRHIWHRSARPMDPLCRRTLCGRQLYGFVKYDSRRMAECSDCLKLERNEREDLCRG